MNVNEQRIFASYMTRAAGMLEPAASEVRGAKGNDESRTWAANMIDHLGNEVDRIREKLLLLLETGYPG